VNDHCRYFYFSLIKKATGPLPN